MDLDEALTVVVSRDGDRLLSVGFQLTHERAAAQDLVQEALLRVYSAVRRGGREPRDWYAYLRRAVINEFLRTRRLRSGTEVVADRVPEAPPTSRRKAGSMIARRCGPRWGSLARGSGLCLCCATTRACRTGRSRPCSAAGRPACAAWRAGAWRRCDSPQRRPPLRRRVRHERHRGAGRPGDGRARR